MSVELTAAASRFMLAAYGAGVLLHMDRAPVWCVAVCLGALAWFWLHRRRQLPLPPAALRIIGTLALFGGVAASFGTVGGLSAGSALLLVMGAAKLMEVRRSRDAAVVAAVSLVLVLAACLDRQSLPRVPLYIVSGWIALACIAAIGSVRAGSSARLALATSARTLLLALPFAALCFLLVPRLNGALWSMPSDGSATTGLADEMSPGSITQLSESEAVAFRVNFEGIAPPELERYWRGPVLHEFDGHTWRRQQRGANAVRQQAVPDSPAVRYRILLEPTGRNFLFGLDRIVSISGPRNLISSIDPVNSDGQAVARRPVTDALSYDGVSHLRMLVREPLSTLGRRLDTQLPAGRNPRSLALAQQMRATVASDREYADKVLDYFRDAGFEYTLTPPPLGPDSVDDLVFSTRLGFCGHFASAYATLMRAAGVPARVVTGYLGGTWNPVGGFYTVRQSHAHAWTEVWIEGEGWLRMDPTAAVAGLQQGTAGLLARRGAAMQGVFGEIAWLRNLRDSWDAANNWWQERVVNFNRLAQQELLRRLGLGNIDYGGMALLLAGGALAWAAALLIVFMRKTRSPGADALHHAWNRYVGLLQARGLPMASHETAGSIAARAASRWPAAAADIQEFTRRYEQLRFGTLSCNKAALTALRPVRRRIARATAAGHRPRTAAATPG